jgi:hypothetical protein
LPQNRNSVASAFFGKEERHLGLLSTVNSSSYNPKMSGTTAFTHGLKEKESVQPVSAWNLSPIQIKEKGEEESPQSNLSEENLRRHEKEQDRIMSAFLADE